MADKKATSEKLLHRMTKRADKPGSSKPQVTKKKKKVSKEEELLDQYRVIRNDILKLRDDLQDGYDMARGMVGRKSIFKQLFRSR